MVKVSSGKFLFLIMIPELGSAGWMLSVDLIPEWTPIPVRVIGFEIVVWFISSLFCAVRMLRYTAYDMHVFGGTQHERDIYLLSFNPFVLSDCVSNRIEGFERFFLNKKMAGLLPGLSLFKFYLATCAVCGCSPPV